MWLRSRAPMSARFRYALLAVSALLIVDPSAAAMDQEAGFSDGWRWRVFDRQEGLPAGGVLVLYQDSYDHIYGAGEEGVARYDLWEWTRVGGESPFRGQPVRKFVESFGTLYAVTASALWRMQGTAAPVVVYRGSQLHAAESPFGEAYVIDEGQRKHLRVRKEAVDFFDPEVQLPAGPFVDYQIDGTGGHWLVTAHGLFARGAGQRAWSLLGDRELAPELRGRRCRRLYRVRAPGSQYAAAPTVARAASWDELWALFSPPEGGGGTLARLERDRWVAQCSLEGPPIQSIVSDSNHRYYATSEDGRLRYSDDGRNWALIENPGLGKLAVFVELVDTGGAVWFRTGAGDVAAFDPSDSRWEFLSTGGQEAYPFVLSVAETEEGEVWIGTRRGLSRWRRDARPENYESVHGVPLRGVTGIAQDALRRVWICAQSFPGAMCFNESVWVTETVPGFSEYPVRRIVKDRLGELWFLSEHREGTRHIIYRSSRYTSFDIVPVRVPCGPVNDLIRADGADVRGDVLWLATEEGLFRGIVDEGEFRAEERFTEESGLRSRRVFSLAQGPDGSIWVCYPFASAGVTRLKEGVAKHFAVEEGLASPEVWSVAASGQNVWFGTERGFSRFDGECWYNYSIASVESRPMRVLPVLPSVTEPDSVIVGTWGLGAFRFRLKTRGPGPIRPRFVPHAVSIEKGQDGSITFSWDARDYRNDTPPDRLLFRTRIDQEPWTPFTSARSRTVRGCEPGIHLFRVEVRDLDGNRNRDDLYCEFEVEGARPALVVWALLAASSLALVLIAVRAVPRILDRRSRLRAYERLACDFPGAVLALDAAGRVLEVTGSARRSSSSFWRAVFGSAGRHVSELPVFAQPGVRAALARALEGEPFWIEKLRVATEGDEETVVSVRGFPLGRARSAALILLEDKTNRAREECLAERARRLGSLRGFAARLLSSLNEFFGDSAFRELVQGDSRLQERLRKLDGILDRLTSFAGKVADPGQWIPVSANELLEELIGEGSPGSPLARALPPENSIRIDYRGQPGLWRVRGDAARLKEAFLELLENGIEAMKGKGTLTVRTANQRLEEESGPLAPGPYIEVTIRDTGAGILPGDLESVFEPFYSTKAHEQALGIGLSAAYGIVRAHGGDVRLESYPGRGTSVRVLLPAWQGG